MRYCHRSEIPCIPGFQKYMIQIMWLHYFTEVKCSPLKCTLQQCPLLYCTVNQWYLTSLWNPPVCYKWRKPAGQVIAPATCLYFTWNTDFSTAAYSGHHLVENIFPSREAKYVAKNIWHNKSSCTALQYCNTKVHFTAVPSTSLHCNVVVFDHIFSLWSPPVSYRWKKPAG